MVPLPPSLDVGLCPSCSSPRAISVLGDKGSHHKELLLLGACGRDDDGRSEAMSYVILKTTNSARLTLDFLCLAPRLTGK